MRDTSFLVLLAFSIPVSFQTLAFQSPFLLSSTTTIATTRRCARQHQPKRSSALSSIFDDEKKASDGVEFESFNPLKYNASGNSKASFSPNQIISLRKTTMQELTGRMLGSVGDGEAMQQILEEYKDFLLEPLEDLEAVLVSSKEAVLPPFDAPYYVGSFIHYVCSVTGPRFCLYSPNGPIPPISSLSGVYG